MSFWKKGKGAQPSMRPDAPQALPVFTVNTEEEAEQLLVHFGKKSYDGKFYIWPDFTGTLDELDAVTDTLIEYYRERYQGASMGVTRERSVSNVWKFTNEGGQTFIFAEIGRGRRGYTMTVGMEGDREAEDLLRAFQQGMKLTERDAEIARTGNEPAPERVKPKEVVIFRQYPDREVIALFPEIPADPEGDRCLAYTRSDGYGDASCTAVIRETDPASLADYRELKRSLEYLGFDLAIRKDATPEMLRRRRIEAQRRKASPAFPELQMAKNIFGRLAPDTRRRLEAVILNPTEETWEDAHGIILNPDVGMGLTLWQAVLAIDPTFPKSGPSTDYRGRVIDPWPRIPTRELLLAALRYATH